MTVSELENQLRCTANWATYDRTLQYEAVLDLIADWKAMRLALENLADNPEVGINETFVIDHILDTLRLRP